MKKYIKWILLVIFIISLIVTVFLFYKFINRNTDINNQITQLYDERYFRTGISHYKDGVLINENLHLSDDRYVVFTEKYIEYCNIDQVQDGCKKYNYSYNNGTIYIEAEDYFISKGEYNISFSDDGFDLSQLSSVGEVIYHFHIPKG